MTARGFPRRQFMKNAVFQFTRHRRISRLRSNQTFLASQRLALRNYKQIQRLHGNAQPLRLLGDNPTLKMCCKYIILYRLVYVKYFYTTWYKIIKKEI